jgi:2-phospho-L-lactate transferase/gluconeogenesis factor (CofD/UPF0052 family)
MTAVKKYTKRDTAAVVTVVSEQDELEMLRKQQEVGTRQLADARNEIARFGQQNTGSQNGWPPGWRFDDIVD